MTTDRLYVTHILKNIMAVQRLTTQDKSSFLANEDTQAAVLYYLQTMAESTTHLSDPLKALHPGIDWKKIRGFRNIAVHAYLSVDLETVWSIIENDLPPLKSAVESIQRALDEAESGS